MLIDVALFILSGLGFLISLYFTLVYYQKIPANYYLIPRICRMDESTCQTVLSTREARVFGFPNSLLGLIYYLLVVCLTVFAVSTYSSTVVRFLMWVSILVLIFSVYLTYALLFKIKSDCPLCFISHGINLLIALLLLLRS